jgi:hypothetical protein
VLISIAVIAGGCATLRGRRQFDGFSIMPPQGEGWTAREHPEQGVPIAFSLGPPTQERPGTVVAMVQQTYLALPQDLVRLAESVAEDHWKEPRYSRIAFKTAVDRSLGADCIRHAARMEDRGVPGYPAGSVFIFEVRGFRCVHPSDPRLVIDISYSQRFPLGQVWDPVFDPNVEPFLRSLVFTPLPTRERRWEPVRLQRMRLAAKTAAERGEKADAERFCVEALQYVATSTVDSLFEYAALLKALKREGAEAAHARAEKLLEARSQPGTLYIGFVPPDELKRYADLLQELGRGAEAEAMRALASAEDHARKVHFIRFREQSAGREPPIVC